MATSIEGAATAEAGNDLAEYLNTIGWDVETLVGKEYFGSGNLRAVAEREVDLAFVQNDIALANANNQVQTVIPLFPNVCYIFHKASGTEVALEELLVSNKVLISKDDQQFFESLFTYYGINLSSIEFQMIEMLDSVDDFLQLINSEENLVFCVFAAIHNVHVKELVENGWEIYSLEDIDFSNKGSSIEGFCMNYPRAKPFIVPRNFFGQKPELPIYTISMDELLIAHENADDELIFDLVNDIYDGKQYLGQQNILFTHIKEDFDRSSLNFPLHMGAVNYLKRDEPSFFERYAEAFGVIFSILVVLVGGITSLKKIQKERIDKYYRKVMSCNDLDELDTLTDEAVKQLQNEKLSADESFTIFLNLIERRRNELKEMPLNNS